MLYALLLVAAIHAGPAVRFEDLNRFPPAKASLDLWRVATDCRVYWEERRATGYRDEARLEAMRQSAEWCWECWDALTDAQAEPDWHFTDQRRLAGLEHLRDLLGPDAWAAGRMPPPVPIWQYVEVP